MSGLQLTRTQTLAMALDRNLSVTAGAGTGKTRVLTSRFLRILAGARDSGMFAAHPGARPARLVAVTFTRKAAHEMRERVSKAVNEQVHGAREAGDAQAYAFWVGIRRDLEEATIQTIHGLAARMVRLAALELGVDPRFRVVEGLEARLMVEDALRAVLADPPPEALQGLRELYVLRGAQGVRGMVRALVHDRVHADPWAKRLSEAGVDAVLDDLWRTHVDVDDEEVREVVSRLRSIHDEVQERIRVAPPQEAKAHTFLSALSACAGAGDDPRACLQATWNLLDLCTSQEGAWYRGPHHATGPAREWDAMGASAVHKETFERLEAVLGPWVGRLTGVPGESDRRVLQVGEAVARVFRRVVERYDAAKQRRGVLDYHDLEVFARKALDRPGVAELLRRRTRYLLVDEFQDTNEHQWAILKALARPPVELEMLEGSEEPVDVEGSGGWSTGEELTGVKTPSSSPSSSPSTHAPGAQSAEAEAVAKEERLSLMEVEEFAQGDRDEPLGEDRLFIVGDAKQSIYSFRGADVTVYEASREAVVEANTHHGLDQDPLDTRGLIEEDEAGVCTQRECQGEVALDRNFRSLPGLVAFTNRFFDRLLAPQDPDGVRQRFEAEPGPLVAQRKGLRSHEEAKGKGSSPGEFEPGSVRILVTPQGFEDAVARGELTTQQADRYGPARYQFARLVQDIRHRVQGAEEAQRLRVSTQETDAAGVEGSRPVRWQDVAVLLPRKTNLRLLEEQLRAHDVPYVVVGGRGFWSRQEVADAVNLLAVVAEPQRDVEFLGVLRSAFFAWTDEAIALLSDVDGASLWHRLHRVADGEAEWVPPASFEGVPPEEVVARITRWRKRSAGTGAARLLLEILDESPYMAALSAYAPETTGRAAVENLEKLVGLVRDLEHRRGRSLVPLLRDLLALSEQDAEEAEAVLPGEEEAGVRVMTVHAAKGLQFPVVYVAELDARLQTGLSKDARGLEYARLQDQGFYVFKSRGEDGEEEDSFLRRLVRDEARRRAHAEYKRLLYVAATRAQDHLVFTGCSERLGPRPGRNPPSLKALAEGRSWMEWMERVFNLDHGVYEELLEQANGSRVIELGEEDDPGETQRARLLVDVRAPVLPETGSAIGTPEDEIGDGDEMDPLPGDPEPGLSVEPVRPRQAPAAVRVSPSQLSVYAECKARFRYRVIDGLSEGWVQGVQSGSPPFGETFGSLLHRALASGASQDDPLPEGVRRRAWALAKRHAGAGWPSAEAVVDRLRVHVLRALDALEGDLDAQAVLVESGVDAEVAPGLRVVGRLDRVHRDDQGRYVVVDLKTDHVSGGKEADHARVHGHDAQVALYDAALRRAGLETGPPALVYSATGHLLRVPKAGGEGEADVVAELAHRVRQTSHLSGEDRPEASDDLEALWPRTASSLRTCQGCGFWRENGGSCEGVTAR